MWWLYSSKYTTDATLYGKTAIVTGANSGIGKATAREFALRGATVIMACRNMNKAKKAAEEVGKDAPGEVLVEHLDLASFKSIKDFAQRIHNNHDSVHLLVNNAGNISPVRTLSQDGYESIFATNHLGHFLLTHLLLPMMVKSPSRIINVASTFHAYCTSMHFDDINMEKCFSPLKAYNRSKCANILFTKELINLLKGTNVVVYCVHPGVVLTEVCKNFDDLIFPGFEMIFRAIGWLFLKTPEDGAQTILYCSLDENLAQQTGMYYVDCKPAEPSGLANNDEAAKQLWDVSMSMVNAKNFRLHL